MSAVILPFRRLVPKSRSDAVFAAINIAARRMGYSEHLALRAARLARQDVVAGRGSAAAVVSRVKAELSLAAKRTKA